MNKDLAARVLENRSTEVAVIRDEPPTKARLLIVDDEPHILEGLALHLRRRFEIVARTNGADALRALDDEGPFSAVLSDLRMPGMDGVQLLSEVRRRSPGTSRVLLTGHGDLEAAVAAVNDAGVHRFLTKPCAPAKLAAALEEALLASAESEPRELGEQIARVGRQAALGTMAGSIGQEIGNLVSALAGSVAAVRDQVEHGQSPTTEDIGLLDLVRIRLGNHARQLTNLSKPRASAVTDVELLGLLCSTTQLLEGTGALRGVRVALSLPPCPVYVRADASLLEGVFINLLKNAAEAIESQASARDHAPFDLLTMKRHDPSVIGVRVEVKEEQVTLAVEDNGPGIAQADLARLFDAYFTTKTPDKGTGLGLAIVRETIGRHGGTVRAESVVGAGTRIIIDLPLSGAPPLPSQRRPASGIESAIRASGR
jgi:signal transduction histidine kinase